MSEQKLQENYFVKTENLGSKNQARIVAKVANAKGHDVSRPEVFSGDPISAFSTSSIHFIRLYFS